MLPSAAFVVWLMQSAVQGAGPIGGSDFSATLDGVHARQTEGKDFWTEMVPGEAPQHAHAAGIAEVSVEEVAKVVRDFAHFKDIFPQMEESRVLSSAGRIISGHIRIVILGFGGLARIPLSADVKQIESRGEGQPMTIYFKERPSGRSSFKQYDLDVKLTSLGPTQTLLELWGSFIPDIPFVPDSLLEEENRKLVRRGVRGIRLRSQGVAFNPSDL